MALTREKKEEILASYQEQLADAPHAVLVDFKGITVPQDSQLRQKVRDSGGSYLVVKNTLALQAVEGKALGQLDKFFEGPTAVAFTDGDGDVVALTKALTDFAKDVPALEFKAGLVNSQVVAGDQINEIASLPSREELIAKLLFLLQSPMARLTRGLAAITRDFVVVLDQVRVQKEGT